MSSAVSNVGCHGLDLYLHAGVACDGQVVWRSSGAATEDTPDYVHAAAQGHLEPHQAEVPPQGPALRQGASYHLNTAPNAYTRAAGSPLSST